jgi:hypothetical protein
MQTGFLLTGGGMSLKEWSDFFRKQGIQNNHSWVEYSKGKAMIQYPLMNLSSTEYEKAIIALAKVVGV